MSSLIKLKKFSASTETLAVALSLTVYAGLLAYLIPRHEPWADEAQAWELAKTLSLKSLFGTYIHYECSPGLWHSLLWLLARLHVTYNGMHWFSGAIALASMAILMLAAPFPLPVRILLPFTYFFAFQYAVVARSYVLIPALLFALAYLWPTRREHPFALALLLGSLANVALHGFAIAIGLGIVLAIEWQSISKLEQPFRNMWLVATVLFSVMVGFALWCILPAPDAGWLVLAKQMPSSVAVSGTANHSSMQNLPLPLLFAISTLLRFVHVISYGFTDKFHLGILAWAVLVWQTVRQGKLRYILPVIALAILCMYSLFSFYHAGLFWVLFLFIWWVTWPENTLDFEKKNLMQLALLIIVALCMTTQLVWTADAARYDMSKPYSPSRDGAIILQRYLDQRKKVDVAVASKEEGGGTEQYFITEIEPYFATEPIHNKTHRFWFWGGDDDLREKYVEDSEHQSVVVVVEEIEDSHGSQNEEKRLKVLGYHRAETTCGQAYYPDASASIVCDVFFQPALERGNKP